MTTTEKIEALRVLNEQQLSLAAEMQKSDAHASKCVKFGKDYQSEYPEEFSRYEQARVQYNRNEQEIMRISAIVPEDEHHEG